jgi:transcription antitermination factor NusG
MLIMPGQSVEAGMSLWTVAVTWPHYERRVEKALAQHGFDHYLPKFKTERRATALLFPRYVFAGPAEQWQQLRKVYGVSRLLRRGDLPATVPEDCVLALQNKEDAEGFIKLPRRPRFRVGQRVRITLGAFTGQIGTYRGRKRNRDRIDLELGEVILPVNNLVEVE